MLTRRGYAILTTLPSFTLLSLIVPHLSYASILVSTLILFNYALFRLRVRRATNLTISRKLSKDGAYLGEVVEAELFMRCRGSLGLVDLSEKHSKNIEIVSGNSFRLDLEYSSEASIRYMAKVVGLGKAVFHGVWIVVRDPLDLFNQSLFFKIRSEVRVYPKGWVRGLFLRESGVYESFKGRFGPEFDGIKEYTCSEDYRLIAWKLVAKRGVEKLLVKKLSGDLNLNLVFILDSSSRMDFGFKGLRKIDYAISSVLSVSIKALMDGSRVTIIAFPSMKVFKVRGGTQSIPNLMKFLGEIEVEDFEGEIHFAGVGRGIYFCILDENTYFKVKDKLKGLASRGIRVFVYVMDSLKLLKLRVKDESSKAAFKLISELFRRDFREEFIGFMKVRVPEPSKLAESILKDYLSVRRVESTIK